VSTLAISTAPVAHEPDAASGGVESMAHIERVRSIRREAAGRSRTLTRYKVRYRDHGGRQHSETKTRLVDAERRRAEIELSLAGATWQDPRRGDICLGEWAGEWMVKRSK
jgi:hypothetical protein